MARPWDRLPRESDQAWQAFREYRDLGPGRTAQRVADIVGKSTFHIHTYSSRFAWVQRARAFEEWLDGKRIDEFEKSVRDMARKHALAAEFMWRKAMEVIQKTPVEEITIRDAIAMFRAALPMERTSRAADLPPPRPMHVMPPAQEPDPEAAPEPTPEQLEAQLAEEEVPPEPPPTAEE